MPKKNLPRKNIIGISKKVLSAAHIQSLTKSSPYSDGDLEAFETAWSSSLAGTVIDKKLEFVFGGGIKPTFELRDETGLDDEQIKAKLKEFDGLKQKIIDYERQTKINFTANALEAATRAKVYGRAVIAFEPDVQDDEVRESPPTALKLIHPRDLGQPIINEEDWSIAGVNLGKGSTDAIEAKDMIYLVNKPNNPIKDNIGYGFSEIQRILGSSKALRRLLEFDAPEIAQAMWANYGMFIIDTEGLTDTQATNKINTLLNSLKAGAFNAISGKKEEIQWMPVELKAHVQDIVSLVDMYERTIDGSMGVPSALLGREEDSNMATLFGKIRLFLAGPVRADREWLASCFGVQWYTKLVEWFDKEALNTIRVSVEFEPVVIEEWADQIDALQKLKQTIPTFPDSAILQIAGLEEFKDDLDKESEPIQQQLKEKENFFREAKLYLDKVNKRKKK